MLKGDDLVGTITIYRLEVITVTDKQVALVENLRRPGRIAIENVRLFDEIQDKSHQLAEASKHKSQFLANMSHELRTPLNAILGYTELVLDGIYGEAPQKARTCSSASKATAHLLGLINDVLDLSKIEAGELKLSLTGYSMKDVVTTCSARSSRWRRRRSSISRSTCARLPPGQGDERRLSQVLLNLVGNAIQVHRLRRGGDQDRRSDGLFSVRRP